MDIAKFFQARPPSESFKLAYRQKQNAAAAPRGQVRGTQPPAPARAKFDPNARLYRVTIDPKTKVVTHTEISPKDIQKKNAHIWINGIANEPDKAAKLGGYHTGKKEFYMIHNPTGGMLGDLGESTLQKLGLRTKVANSTRDLLRHFDLPSANVTAHSQGTMILNSALGDLRKEGKDMRGMNLNYHGAAANNLLSAGLAHRVGAHIQNFQGHALDPVHNIVGMNTLNPLRIVGSVLAAPLLFNSDPDKSSHTKPDGQAKKLGPIFQSDLFNPLFPTRYP
jgi:hypothetical protein